VIHTREKVMNRPRIRITGLATAFLLASLAVVFGPAALTRCPIPTTAGRIATAIGTAGLLVVRLVFRRPADRRDDRPTSDIARRWRELDLLQNALDARDSVPAAVRAHLDTAYEYLILGREPGAAAWHARQVERWLRHHH
jgi:hypothetical protein